MGIETKEKAAEARKEEERREEEQAAEELTGDQVRSLQAKQRQLYCGTCGTSAPVDRKTFDDENVNARSWCGR